LKIFRRKDPCRDFFSDFAILYEYAYVVFLFFQNNSAHRGIKKNARIHRILLAFLADSVISPSRIPIVRLYLLNATGEEEEDKDKDKDKEERNNA